MNTGGPLLLCQRNASNRNARDLAESMQLHSHVQMIDQTVKGWLTSDRTDAHTKRTLLALYSYNLTDIFESVDPTHLEEYKSEFYRLQVKINQTNLFFCSFPTVFFGN